MPKIKPCDICGVIPYVQKSYSGRLIIHRCRDFSSGWGGNEAVVEKWNSSNSQENAEAETQSAPPTNNGSTCASQIADSMEAACFPEPGEFIMPRESWLKEWCRQLRTCR